MVLARLILYWCLLVHIQILVYKMHLEPAYVREVNMLFPTEQIFKYYLPLVQIAARFALFSYLVALSNGCYSVRSSSHTSLSRPHFPT